ncbi:MAG: TIGR04283 family arsenosugar biosynthesis glycosyltransferase [Rubripirellula sp.]
MITSEISVVIPAINEELQIGLAIQSAQNAGAGEVIVVDGGSQDNTVSEAITAGATKVVHSLPGRGVQLNSGAALVTTSQKVILFLHADNRLHKDCLNQICEQQNVIWGAFRQNINSRRFIYRIIEYGNALRVSVRKLPFGDQAIFVRKDVYEKRGGFEEIPLMEDVSFSIKMRRMSKPRLLAGPIEVNCRRWQKKGVLPQTLQNWILQFAYSIGVRPEVLRQWYR